MNIMNLTIKQINELPNTQNTFDELTAFGLSERNTWNKLVVIAIRDHVFACSSNKVSTVPYCCYDCSCHSGDLLLREFCGSKRRMPIEFYQMTGLLAMFEKGALNELRDLRLFDHRDAIDTLRATPIRFCYTFEYTAHIGDMNKGS